MSIWSVQLCSPDHLAAICIETASAAVAEAPRDTLQQLVSSNIHSSCAALGSNSTRGEEGGESESGCGGTALPIRMWECVPLVSERYMGSLGDPQLAGYSSAKQ